MPLAASPSAAPSAAASSRTGPVAAPPGYSPVAPLVEPGRACRYCCAEVPGAARKCRACGEWLVRTSSGIAAPLLRLLGWVWSALSIVVAATLWYVGGAIRTQLLMHSADEYLTPLGIDVAIYAIVALVLLQGLTVGIGLNVLARLAPRRPYWWSG